MQAPTQYWLTAAQYLEEKRAVLVSFSQLGLRRTIRLPFFPFFFVNKKTVGRQLLDEVLSSYDKRKFIVKEEKHAFKVTAATFKDLNCLANLVFTSINFIPVVLPPERLFLLEKGWSYFDCFTFQEEQPLKFGGSALPAVLLPFFSEPVPETVGALI